MTNIAIICTTPEEFRNEVSKRTLNGILISEGKKRIECQFGRSRTSLFHMVQINPYKPGIVDAIGRQTRGYRFDKYYISEMEVDCLHDVMTAMKFKMIDDK